MSTVYVIALAASVAAILSARWLIGSLPLRRVATHIGPAQAALAAVGILGLVFHCGAMFFPAVFNRLPGSHRAIIEINDLGAVSRIWYVAAAALVLIGLRRQHLIGRVIVALTLVAVGVTMYDGGPLGTHLAAIFASGMVLAGVVAALVLPPSPTRRTQLRRANA